MPVSAKRVYELGSCSAHDTCGRAAGEPQIQFQASNNFPLGWSDSPVRKYFRTHVIIFASTLSTCTRARVRAHTHAKKKELKKLERGHIIHVILLVYDRVAYKPMQA